MEMKVIGPNTTDRVMSVWHFRTLDEANAFAQQLARDTGAKVDVCKVIGTWAVPVEYTPAEDEEAPA